MGEAQRAARYAPRVEETKKPAPRRSRVPTGRLERLLRMGWMAGELAAGGLAASARAALGASPTATFLSAERGRRLARRLAQMRGAAMKLGQLLSLEGDDLLPAEFSEALAVLRAAADTMPATQVRRVLGREYGRGWQERFRRFDFDPMASASIGQVHEAVAVDGRELALKIQYPGVRRSIDSDVDNLAALLRLSHVLPVELDVGALIAEAKRQLRQEADYEQEARHLKRYRELVADDPSVCVPRVHDDLTTGRVLAMDRLHGRPIEELRGAEYPQSLRDDIGQRLQRLMFRELFEFHFMQTDPNFANYLFDPGSGRLVLLDFGSALEFEPEFIGLYARMCRAMIARDREGVRRLAVEIGYLPEVEREDRVEALVDLILLIGEPLRHEGVYDFGASNLAPRARAAGFDLAFRRGFLRAPPPRTIFLHRKLGGTFLLCSHIRARVDAHALIAPHLVRLWDTAPQRPGAGRVGRAPSPRLG
jgi:predicted unusual protein kinase regulating ubiquinone biosynthesis (AarF/ABC1/UbiB family)